VIAFFARPAAQDGRLERPHSLIVPRGTPLTLHLQVFSASKLSVHAKRVSGVLSTVPLPNQGALDLDGKPHKVVAQFTPQHDVTLLFSAFNGAQKAEAREPIRVYVYDPAPGAKPVVRAQGDRFDLV
jgi:hypothetical protein